MSPRNFRVASAFSCIFVAALAGPAVAVELPKPTASYSATQTVTAEGETMKAKLFRDKDKMRIDNDEGGSMIFDAPNQRMVMIMPGMPMAMAMPLDPTKEWDQPNALDHCQVEAGGRETIRGEATTLYTIDCPAKDKDAPWKGEIAVTADGIPMRMDMETIENGKPAPVKAELSDVKRGPQPASLFQLPAGVEVGTMPGMPAMPGGR